MKKIKIETEVYNVPESWKDISLKHYETFCDFIIENKINEIQLVSKVSSIPFTVLADLPLSFYTDILNTILFIFQNIQYKPLSYIKDDEGNVYYVNTKEELTLAQYVDIENVYETESNENKLSEVLAICCLKKDEKYRTELLEVRKEMFSNMSMDKLFPVLTFFLQLDRKLQKCIEIYSRIQERINKFQDSIKSSPKSGDGKN
ncbi:hypothetical protein EZS27_016881 [termite gut metagenome]|uniref:Uncharacterized protein n=1 Tax=termite gut metagenome TaxID=433724 RepID=A0A5J4RMF5_9ZZZZ